MNPESSPERTQSRVSLSDVFTIARERWFKVSELEYLVNPKTTPLPISTSTLPGPPKSGTILLFDRTIIRNYKTDGHRWVKRRNSTKVREDHVKLRTNGRNRIAGFYAHSEDVVTLHRRSYNLLSPDSAAASSRSVKEGTDLVLVHYLDTANDPERIISPDCDLGMKRKRAVSVEPDTCRSKIKPSGEVYSSGVTPVVGRLYGECSVLTSLRNRLSLFRLARLEQQLSQLRSVDRYLMQRRQARAKDSFSNNVLRQKQLEIVRDQDVIDDDTLEALQGLGSSGEKIESNVCECNGIIRKSNCDMSIGEGSMPVSAPRSFEADFDILWTHLCDEFGSTVSVSVGISVTGIFW
eukprot:CAMPEP_0172480192 /NCGR_PEP_ID=MMETSP1066-20121228/5226_1 /TAXON_ID=671091 /ORGANISM="Coscinodiscus wailesii, Strain CCMP2513" /LENGTH=350 /DNA_ID=CAMNT_0013241313 /DNA_START=79 /DNA_END=1128 /DNA_ORIENTATION=+